jgi:hypothetical protein
MMTSTLRRSPACMRLGAFPVFQVNNEHLKVKGISELLKAS